MQPISDKDFDKLFHDRLNAFAVEPSAHVWAEIEKQLNTKKKKPFPVLWLAAACLAAVIAAGLLFAPGQESIKLTGVTNGKVEEVATMDASPKPNNISIEQEKPKPVNPVAESITRKPVYVSAKNSVQPEEEVVLASNNLERSNPPADKVRNPRTEPIARGTEVVKPLSETTVIASTLTEQPTPEIQDEMVSENRNSKSVVSSVVNFVVGKVDRRKDKIIELEHNDEGTKVKSMNLILLKFKSKD